MEITAVKEVWKYDLPIIIKFGELWFDFLQELLIV